jgi:glycosyltransferase involved in cell wall biosynthesis
MKLKKKYLFISNMAAPYQVKFCYALQEYFDAEFWFYEQIDETRPDWWKIPLGEKCKVLRGSGKLPKVGYFSIGLLIDLFRFKPDIVVLGGYMKWHVIVAALAKMMGSKVAVMSEPLRYVNNDDDKSVELINKKNSLKKIKLIKRLFKNIDLYIGMGDVAVKQLIEEFEFPEKKVANLNYPQDIDEYYNHPLRKKQKGDKFTLLFANRLVERYQPLFALEVFKQLEKRYLNIEMYMNASGALKDECVNFIKENKLNKVYFLDEIDSWNEMHLIYKESDILIFPCCYSNGNGTIFESGVSGMGLVISNKINCMEEFVINNKNCFICDLDIKQFFDAISNYIENPDILINHGELSRELGKPRRNDNIAKEYFHVFKEHAFLN